MSESSSAKSMAIEEEIVDEEEEEDALESLMQELANRSKYGKMCDTK